jgi:hypothetical protein
MKLFFASGQTSEFIARLHTIISSYSQHIKGTALNKVLVSDPENFNLLISQEAKFRYCLGRRVHII